MGSIIPMAVIMPTLLLIGLSNITGLQILVPLGKEKVVLYSEIGGVVTNVIFNSILIPLLAEIGAAIGTVIAETVVLVIQCIFLKDEIKNLIKDIKVERIIMAIGIATAACIWVKVIDVHYMISMIISSIVFFGIYGIYMLIRKDDTITEIFDMVKHKMARKEI